MFINIGQYTFIYSYTDMINEGSYKRLNEHDIMIALLWYNYNGTGKLHYHGCMQDIMKHDKSKGKKLE